ncbi:hypothetical protein BRARA_H00400 [Brassica rapa]|uniref:Uncharacterized protein n=1 Tax=Brassica campestris TaxID=3711 RepID=A0A397Y7Q8_BRACM|nr:hypothetical protein BRARA_H00400 [Brassica rapa]
MFSFSFLKAQRDLESIREVYTLLKIDLSAFL